MGFELYFQRFFVCLVEDEDLKGILCSLGLIVWECACRGSEEWLNGRKGKKFSCSASVIFFFILNNVSTDEVFLIFEWYVVIIYNDKAFSQSLLLINVLKLLDFL